MSAESKTNTLVILGIAFMIGLFALAAKSLPSYEEYCKEPQARCDLNRNHDDSIWNIIDTLKAGPKH